MYKRRLSKENFAAFAILFAIQGMNLLAIYPTLPYFIQWTLNDLDKLEPKSRSWHIAGAYSFYILVYNMTQFFSVFLWSLCVQKLNFKIMIVMGLIVNGLFFGGSALLKGQFYLALVFRGVQGLVSINTPLVKLLLQNYITHQYEEAKVFVLTSLWTAGAILGMTLTSLFSSSTSSDTLLKSAFLLEYLYFIPYVIIALLNGIAAIVVAVHFPATQDDQAKCQYFKSMENSLKMQKKLLISHSDCSLYLTSPNKTRTICNSVLRRSLCAQKGIGVSLTIYFLSNFLFFAVFESVPIIYKDIFAMTDAQIAGLYFSIGLLIMFLTDNILAERESVYGRTSLRYARGMWLGIVIFFGCGLFIHYISAISFTLKLIVLLIWEVFFMLLFTLGQQSNISILQFAASQNTRAFAQDHGQILGSVGRIIGSFLGIQTMTWSFRQFDFDLIGECGVMSLEKGMIFVLVTFVAALVWLLHFQYSQVFNQLKYSSAEEARFFNQVRERKPFAKAHSSDNESQPNYAQTDQ